jgi:two-component system response regulator LytT
MRVVIIEDEQFTAEDLANTIRDLRANYSIVQIIPSVKESIDFFSKQKEVDLVFSDVHLGDGLSFEIFRTGHCTCPVIFCTAYDNYAIQAFKANGIDYVLKPIDKKSILEAIEKYERLSQPNSNSQLMNDLLSLFKPAKAENKFGSILVHQKDKIIPVKLEEISVFYIRNESTWIVDANGKSYAINETLEDVEHLNAPFLFRANRQYIVNRNVVKDATQHFARKLILNLKVPFNEQISVSKERSPALLKWLEDF